MNWVQLELDLRIEGVDIIEYVKQWLQSNMEEPPVEGVAEDSANLLQKINEMEEEYYG
jgi:hypothetical protein